MASDSVDEESAAGEEGEAAENILAQLEASNAALLATE
jgi:hypothetical protein